MDLLFAHVGRRNETPAHSRRRLNLANLSVVVLALVFAGGQTTYYFGPHLTTFNRDFRLASWAPDGQDAVLRSLDFPKHTQIHLVSKWEYDFGYARAIMGFFRNDLEVDSLEADEFTDAYLEKLPRDVDHAFYLEPDNLDLLLLVREHFTVEQPRFTPYELPRNKAFILYYAPAALNQGRGDE